MTTTTERDAPVTEKELAEALKLLGWCDEPRTLLAVLDETGKKLIESVALTLRETRKRRAR